MADPEKMAERKRFAAAKEARIAQLTENLGELALNAEREETRVSATIAALNRLEGMPRQRVENDNRDLTLEDMLRNAAARGKQDAGSA
jgi:hypothetical protein